MDSPGWMNTSRRRWLGWGKYWAGKWILTYPSVCFGSCSLHYDLPLSIWNEPNFLLFHSAQCRSVKTVTVDQHYSIIVTELIQLNSIYDSRSQLAWEWLDFLQGDSWSYWHGDWGRERGSCWGLKRSLFTFSIFLKVFRVELGDLHNALTSQHPEDFLVGKFTDVLDLKTKYRSIVCYQPIQGGAGTWAGLYVG